MKLLFIALFLGLTLTVASQETRSTTKNISDDGKTLKFKYEVKAEGKNIRYYNEFEIAGWTKVQKDQLVSRIIDSLENNTQSQGDYMHKRIDDTGENLTITIDGRKKGKTITYNKSFDVKGMTKAQKDAILEDVLKYLGLKEKD